MLDASGQLEKLLVERGEVELLGKGWNNTELDYFDIIARTSKINADIHGGKELEVITGHGEFTPRDRQFKSTQSTSKPSIAIDSSHLGGLYAGKITLIGNEDGVGVNAPNMVSTSSDIQLTAGGKLVHKNINSAAKIKVRSESNIIAAEEAKIDSSGTMNYHAKDGIKIDDQAILKPQSAINLKSDNGAIENRGKIIAVKSGHINLTAKSLENHDTIYAKEGVITGTIIEQALNKGKLDARSGISLNATSFINSGIVRTYGNADIVTTGQFFNQDGAQIKSKSKLNILAASLDNYGKVIAPDINISTKYNINNTDVIHADHVVITSLHGAIDNGGTITSRGALKLRAQDAITNSGKILAPKNELTLKSIRGVVNNHGDLIAPIISINADRNIINSQLIESSNLIINSDQGSLENSGNISFTSDKANAVITLGGDLKNLSGAELIGNALEITTKGKLLNEKNAYIISRVGKIKLDVGADFDNSGYVGSENDISGQITGRIDNAGDIISSKKLNLIAKQGITNLIGGYIESGAEFIIKSHEELANPIGLNQYSLNQDFQNLGDIFSGRDTEIQFAGAINNIGYIESPGDFVANSSLSSVVNSGVIISDKESKIISFSNFSNAGTIISDGKLSISSNQTIQNSNLISTNAAMDILAKLDVENIDRGKIESTGDLTITSTDGRVLNINNDPLNYRDNSIISFANFNINAKEGVENNKGYIQSENDMTIKTPASIANIDGNIISLGKIKLLTDAQIDNSGIIQAEDDLLLKGLDTMEVEGLENKGVINSLAGIDIQAHKDSRNSGLLLAKDNIKFNVENGSVLNNNIILSDRGNVYISVSDNIENREEAANIIALNGRIDINSGRNLINSGLLIAQDQHIIAANKLDNDGGNISARGDLVIDAKDIINKSIAGKEDKTASIKAAKSLSINAAGDINNSGNIELNDGNIKSIYGNIINNKLIHSSQLRALLAKQSINNHGEIDVTNLTVEAGQALRNNNQIKVANKFTIKNTPVLENNDLIKFKELLSLDKILRINNKKDATLEGDFLTLDAKEFINVGEITLDSALDLTVDRFSSNILSAGKNSKIVIKEDFTNDHELHIKNADLTLKARSITNKGELKVDKLIINTDGKVLMMK